MPRLRGKELKSKTQESSKANTNQAPQMRPSFNLKEGPSDESRFEHGLIKNIIFVEPKDENVNQTEVKPQFCGEKLMPPLHQRPDQKVMYS